jgi:cell division septation protein DedD
MSKQTRTGLGLWDRLVLLVAWAVTCGLVYVLGFYVGKGTQERRLGLEERVVRLPVTSQPPPGGQRPPAAQDLTFYDTLVAGRHPEADTAGRPEPPARRAGPIVAAATPTTLPVRPTPTTLLPRIVPSTLAPSAPPPTAVPPRAVPTTLPARSTPPAVPPPVAVARPVPNPSPPVGGGWTVIADLTRSRDDAESLQRQLRGHGYDATVMRVARDGDTWYRVRVGRYSTNAQAEEVRQRLREHEGVTHVFVASE